MRERDACLEALPSGKAPQHEVDINKRLHPEVLALASLEGCATSETEPC